LLCSRVVRLLLAFSNQPCVYLAPLLPGAQSLIWDAFRLLSGVPFTQRKPPHHRSLLDKISRYVPPWRERITYSSLSRRTTAHHLFSAMFLRTCPAPRVLTTSLPPFQVPPRRARDSTRACSIFSRASYHPLRCCFHPLFSGCTNEARDALACCPAPHLPTTSSPFE